MNCKKCNFDDEFIIDYNEKGEEYTFCGNCGTIADIPNESTAYGTDCPNGSCEF